MTGENELRRRCDHRHGVPLSRRCRSRCLLAKPVRRRRIDQHAERRGAACRRAFRPSCCAIRPTSRLPRCSPDIDQFDAAFFEYSPEEARLMDPQQRLLLEVAWEAFEDAGQPVGRRSPVGVFTGLGGVVSSYLVDRLPFSAELPGYTGSLTHLGNDKDFASTRISYKLNLTGPSLNVQTACSTSLVAVHLACQAILAGECDMALAGAATVRVPQRVGYTSVKGGILSPDGHCRAFDADAQGTIFGSGVGASCSRILPPPSPMAITSMPSSEDRRSTMMAPTR